MALGHGRNFGQLLKSFNLIYICLGRFLYAVGPSELRFYMRPACTCATIAPNFITCYMFLKRFQYYSDYRAYSLREIYDDLFLRRTIYHQSPP